MEKLLALHRYYIWTNRLREHFDQAAYSSLSVKSIAENFASDTGLFLSHWYAALYVVVEGWKELGLSDPVIDQLLASPNTELLRRYRNGVCHFQDAYFDARFTEFIKAQGIVEWVRDLNIEFGRYFLSVLKPKDTHD